MEEGRDGHEHAAAFFESGAMSASKASGNVDLQPARIEIAATVRVTFALVPS